MVLPKDEVHTESFRKITKQMVEYVRGGLQRNRIHRPLIVNNNINVAINLAININVISNKEK